MNSPHNEYGGHETSHLSVRGVVAAGIAVALLVVVTLFLMWQISLSLTVQSAPENRTPGHSPTSGPPPRKPLASEPPLQTAPGADLRRIRAAEDEILTTYGWIDRDAGIVRIPIERAMDLLADDIAPHPADSGE